jgi:redox-sensitive bicupin YhaK (pirin superfamily)
MVTVRRSEERGHFDHGWLQTYHTFSFAGYHDPAHMGFRGLRVINQDQVGPGEGFGTHPHRDMEIITYVTEGSLRHRDSMGTGSVIRAGEVQRMSAGRGVTHSEFNDSAQEPVHLFQIWIVPDTMGLEPSYQEAPAPRNSRTLETIAAPAGEPAPLLIHADARVLLGDLAPGEPVHYPLERGRGAWLQVVKGAVQVNGESLGQGDGAALEGEEAVVLQAETPAEVLLFDLA